MMGRKGKNVPAKDDFVAVFNNLIDRTQSPYPLEVEAVVRAAGTALQRKLTANPEEAIEGIFQLMIGFDTQMWFRVRATIEKMMARRGSGYVSKLPADVVEIWLPRLDRIQTNMLETIAAFSKNKHVLQITRKKDERTKDKQKKQRKKMAGTAPKARILKKCTA